MAKNQKPARQGHDRWNMSGKASGAGAHKPRSEKRKGDKLRKEISNW